MSEPTIKGEVTAEEPGRGWQQAARRIAESRATVPSFTLDAAAEIRNGQTDPRALLAAALAGALRAHPRANGAWRDGRWELWSRVNVGLALDGPAGPVTATLFDADTRGAPELAAAIAELEARAADGTITPPELSGATSTLVVVAAPGVERVEPVVAPGHAAALGAALPEPGVAGLVVACDGRVLAPNLAAAFLADVRARLSA